MKHGFGLAALIGITVAAGAIDEDPGNRFTVTGQYVEKESILGVDSSGRQSSEIMYPTVTLTTKKRDDETNEFVEIASGKFSGGEVIFDGEIDDPTEVTISVVMEQGAKLTIDALLQPGGPNVSFVLIEGSDSQSHRLALSEASRRSKVTRNKFIVKGDLGDLTEDLSYATVGVLGHDYVAGDKVSRGFGTVILEDGKFLIENDVYEPRIVYVYVQGGSVYSTVQAVIEPNSEINVSLREGTTQLLATANSGRHKQLVERWQQSEEYLETLDAYTDSYAQFLAQLQSKATENEDDDSSNESEFDETLDEPIEDSEANLPKDTEQVEMEPDQEEDAESDTDALAQNLADGCEHVEVDPVSLMTLTELLKNRDGPEHFKLSEKMDEMRTEALQQIATTSEDPIDVLLAMELEAYGYYDENRSDALGIYDNLATVLDEDLVARRVIPPRESLSRHIEKEENDKKVVPGQKAPNVTLPNLMGREASLYEILADNDVVLIDFWASWCGPCIAAFPELKRLYSEYKTSGFEVVSISIDRTSDAWEEASKENDLPWVNLGENLDWEGPVARTYGVQLIPKNYLVDGKGCILKKFISTDVLEEFLVARFGVTDVLGELE